ncbi:MAG: TlpA family protein disulfide reductase [Nitrospina sp.]|nr:TlpA family protein disulfide reductase [Nitrospina sp.]MBT3856654.1 TlpA family protein disulfide reductase [Nitrospina sp.]MBT4103532.1 TlpA family protein disulfide reductase [Nitrospina sp.]MBT4388761.1 TlpA family protein disulfide reductase [Nitrospina sp.]MBT4619564.1 TlpA family protein disulfide reductase [Nitrospina sp.]
MPLVDSPAIDLDIEEWVLGPSSNISNELGKPILVKVFQVNCPGCFSHGIPQILEIRNKFIDSPLLIWGLATAFEDFHLNNSENLKKLLDSGEVVGETLEVLGAKGLLNNNRLDYSISFPVALDNVVPYQPSDYLLEAQKFIKRDFPQFDSFPVKNQKLISGQVMTYLKQKKFEAKTFEAYQLKGTPSTLLIDKKGILRGKWFGSGYDLEAEVEKLLSY